MIKYRIEKRKHLQKNIKIRDRQCAYREYEKDPGKAGRFGRSEVLRRFGESDIGWNLHINSDNNEKIRI